MKKKQIVILGVVVLVILSIIVVYAAVNKEKIETVQGGSLRNPENIAATPSAQPDADVVAAVDRPDESSAETDRFGATGYEEVDESKLPVTKMRQDVLAYISCGDFKGLQDYLDRNESVYNVNNDYFGEGTQVFWTLLKSDLALWSNMGIQKGNGPAILKNMNTPEMCVGAAIYATMQDKYNCFYSYNSCLVAPPKDEGKELVNLKPLDEDMTQMLSEMYVSGYEYFPAMVGYSATLYGTEYKIYLLETVSGGYIPYMVVNPTRDFTQCVTCLDGQHIVNTFDRFEERTLDDIIFYD